MHCPQFRTLHFRAIEAVAVPETYSIVKDLVAYTGCTRETLSIVYT